MERNVKTLKVVRRIRGFKVTQLERCPSHGEYETIALKRVDHPIPHDENGYYVTHLPSLTVLGPYDFEVASQVYKEMQQGKFLVYQVEKYLNLP